MIHSYAMKWLSISVAILCGLSSCQNFDVGIVLLVRNDVSLTVRGEEQFVYDPLTCQLGYNMEDCEFRVYDDRLGDWFVLRCNVPPDTEGMKVRADIEFTTNDSTVSYDGLEFVVKKTDVSGHVWLWNESRKIGVVISMP